MTIVKTTIEFRYEPIDLFEEPFEMVAQHGVLRFDSGKASYTLATPTEPVPEPMMQGVEAEICAAVRLREMLTHKAATLAGPTTMHDKAGGGRNVAIGVKGGSYTLTGGSVDFVLKEAGKVVHDSKAERIKAHNEFLLAVVPKIGNPTVAKMVRSYQAAVRDRAKELSHLYEIVEAAEFIYGGNRAATLKALDFKKAEWDAITVPANDPHINQGRHTGQAVQTRDATDAELQKARHLARAIVSRYAAKVQ